jgi:hypothetical protein
MNDHAENCRDVVFLVSAPRSAWDELFNLWEAAKKEGWKEINYLFPPALSLVPLNYGQGEGQVEIQGLEIGFYHGTRDRCYIVAHDFPLGKELDHPREIAEQICSYWEKLVSVRFFVCCDHREDIQGFEVMRLH